MNSANLPSSFASAAAGQNANTVRGGRSDGRGSGEWPRREGRATNGTLTFRRPSSNSLGQSTQPALPNDNALQSPAADSVPSSQFAPSSSADLRYSKDELLEIAKLCRSSGSPSQLYMPGWAPGAMNGNVVRSWGKPEHQTSHDPDICWVASGETLPIGFQPYTAEEKEIMSNDINSTMKSAQPKDPNHAVGTTNGRKISQGAPNLNPGLTSPPAATRPTTTRRRETTEATPFGSLNVTSPSAARFSRDDPSPWFSRKAPDVKEAEPDELEDEAAQSSQSALFGRASGLGVIARTNTGGASGLSSLWNSSAPGQSPAPPSTSATAGPPPLGSFGNFALPTANSAIGDKRVGGARESRLAHLIPKDGPGAEKPQDSPSADIARPWASRLADNTGGDPGRPWKARPRTDTDPYGGENLVGSAALGGSSDSPPQAKHTGRGVDTPSKPSAADFGMSRLDLGGGGQQAQEEGPTSPSTNPYQSPPGERRGVGGSSEAEGVATDREFAPLSRGFSTGAFDAGDRSQTSSTGPRAYPTLGSMTAWAPPTTVGPERTNSNFGNAFPSIFDMTSPGASAFGGMFGAGAPGSGRSKMQAIFQSGVQTPENDSLSDSLPDLRQANPLGTIGRNSFGLPARETDSPIRTGRIVFDGFFPTSDASRSNPMFPTDPNVTGATGAAGPGPQPFSAPPPGSEAQQAQVRQMVMPDRMRWVYLDSQNKVQGPFTGLEMNDWYKANFFTADLRVKKVEDPDFEPLGALIRRIGNSREPFLVPQIGIPHGPPSTDGPFSPASGGMVPPLSGVFPSYGRTLTADEQNNLERRKQEEQFMMAQQREFMSRQQVAMNMNITRPHGTGMPGLQHHASAHSLQSQPSFGNISSPAPPAIAPIGAAPTMGNAAMYDPAIMSHMAGVAGLGDVGRDDEAAKWGAEHQVLGLGPNFHASMSNAESMSPQLMGTRLAEATNSLRSQLPRNDQLSEDEEGFRARLQEFDRLRIQHEASEAAAEATLAEAELRLASNESSAREVSPKKHRQSAQDANRDFLIAEQLQQAAAAAAAAGMDIPSPFPSVTEAMHMTAPAAAHRARSNLPEQYEIQEPDSPEFAAAAAAAVQPPPLAPWARDPGLESQKGPSLKEIQEAEARKAAKAEEVAAASRKRQALEQEAASREREKLVTQAPGLPTTSTWGSGSPVTPAAGPWAKPSIATTSAATAAPGAAEKRTLADIQREEELRKQKAKEVAVLSGAPTAGAKSYALLAGKMSAPAPALSQQTGPSVVGAIGGWALVGANGKAKIPTGPAAQTRAVSLVAKPTPPPKPVSKPAPSENDLTEAQEEFKKWVQAQLAKGIDSGVDIDSLAQDLEEFPLDSTIIAEAVYANSKVMDGNHFGLEYVRRKTLADKGVVERQPAISMGKDEGTGAGGWNEVARKGGSHDSHETDVGIQGAGFKVVHGRKKGKK